MKSLKTWQALILGILIGLLISATILLIARRTAKTEIQYTSPTQNIACIQPSVSALNSEAVQIMTATPQKLNINKATITELDSLPGIGEVKAQAIVDFRNHNGEFHSFQDLLYVPGIGQALLAQIQDLITLK